MMETPVTPAPYLSNDRLGLRGPLIEDAAQAQRWFQSGGGDVEETIRELRRLESIPWGGNPVILLVAMDLPSGEIAGGVRIVRSANRTGTLALTVPDMHPRRGDIVADILGLVVPWLVGEIGLMSVVLDAPSDDTGMIRAAEDAGMVEAVRRREHLARPAGRVDLLQFQRVNAEWGRYAG
jgi:RimJ/RimL family protein N-acetyltransferase